MHLNKFVCVGVYHTVCFRKKLDIYLHRKGWYVHGIQFCSASSSLSLFLPPFLSLSPPPLLHPNLVLSHTHTHAHTHTHTHTHTCSAHIHRSYTDLHVSRHSHTHTFTDWQRETHIHTHTLVMRQVWTYFVWTVQAPSSPPPCADWLHITIYFFNAHIDHLVI